MITYLLAHIGNQWVVLGRDAIIDCDTAMEASILCDVLNQVDSDTYVDSVTQKHISRGVCVSEIEHTSLGRHYT